MAVPESPRPFSRLVEGLKVQTCLLEWQRIRRGNPTDFFGSIWRSKMLSLLGTDSGIDESELRPNVLELYVYPGIY
ncbi:hypothetical protein EC919_11545 [Pseudomonas graminis]|nr:hypothetical protein EC919_11545 [Pseudomonas graminis]